MVKYNMECMEEKTRETNLNIRDFNTIYTNFMNVNEVNRILTCFNIIINNNTENLW